VPQSSALKNKNLKINRRLTKSVLVGKIQIGNRAPIVVQSMTKTKTEDVSSTVKQIKQLERAGCEIIRVAVPNQTAAQALKAIKQRIKIPLIADIHFDYRLALVCIKAGADKIRINPGNIGADWKIKEIIKAAKDYEIPIRIGVNAGSLEKDILQKYKSPSARALTESLERSVKFFERNNYDQLILSAKAFDVLTTIEIYELLSKRFRYPLHLGLTEAGLPFEGAIRSATALAVLLAKGIGDTIRISLTGDPVLEVVAAYELLQGLGLRKYGPIIISCPTCGRCEIDLIGLAKSVKTALAKYKTPMKVAVMGCVVNGPGEAKSADFGIAAGKKSGIIFSKGKVVKKCAEKDLVSALLAEIEQSLTA
jgi:(E)-4-hydroxy-3-methylbut-2-enyl-diphosphate synthase